MREGFFRATCRELPGCTSHGYNRQEARKKIDEAIHGYIAAVSDAPENLHYDIAEEP
jgi:predicted RNase H-like HicB family nuclease